MALTFLAIFGLVLNHPLFNISSCLSSCWRRQLQLSVFDPLILSELPIAAYNVSGEYSMVKAAAERGWIDEKANLCHDLIS